MAKSINIKTRHFCRAWVELVEYDYVVDALSTAGVLLEEADADIRSSVEELPVLADYNSGRNTAASHDLDA